MSASNEPKARINVTDLPAPEQELNEADLQQVKGGAGYIEQERQLAGHNPAAAGMVWGTKPAADSPEATGKPASS